MGPRLVSWFNKKKFIFPYLKQKQNMWLSHHVAHSFFGRCRHYKIFKLNFFHPSPSYVIIQVLLVFRKILLCTPKPSTILSSITSYVKKCLRKRLNKLLIYLLNLFPWNHLNISDISWELYLPHLSNLLDFRRLNSVRRFLKDKSSIYVSFYA